MHGSHLYAIKTQLKAFKAPTRGISFLFLCLYGIRVASMHRKDLLKGPRSWRSITSDLWTSLKHNTNLHLTGLSLCYFALQFPDPPWYYSPNSTYYLLSYKVSNCPPERRLAQDIITLIKVWGHSGMTEECWPITYCFLTTTNIIK